MANLTVIKKEISLRWLKLKNQIHVDSDYVITGIPRSGTSLLCAILALSPDAFCFNEVHYNARYLPLFFEGRRRHIKIGGLVANKVDTAGKYITSTNDANKNTINTIDPNVNPERFALGSKVTVPYLNQLTTLLSHGYKVVAMVRDPVYAIGSWNTGKLQDTPMNKVMDPVHPHWAHIKFKSQLKRHRQAEIWEYYANVIWQNRDSLFILKYEDLVDSPSESVRQMSHYLNITPPHDADIDNMGITNKNSAADYDDLRSIGEIVRSRCPTRKKYGYE